MPAVPTFLVPFVRCSAGCCPIVQNAFLSPHPGSRWPDRGAAGRNSELEPVHSDGLWGALFAVPVACDLVKIGDETLDH
jgi:hypothetical protein